MKTQAGSANMPLLQVENLHIALSTDAGSFPAVEGVSFEIARGETVGLVGESGCGKSITALSIMGLLKSPLGLAGGSIRLTGREIQNLPAAELRALRGKRIAMIFQEPMTALNPLKPVGRQIAEMFVLHQGAGWAEAERKAVDALTQVKVPAPARRAKDYPHQLSGGMRQRVMIAIALACEPDLLIADEPTTALDVTVQAEIVDLMKELCAARGTAILMISHDLGLVTDICSRVCVMYAGRIVETGPASEVFAHPRHRYIVALVRTMPAINPPGALLPAIPGQVPAPGARGEGCSFAPRCDAPVAACAARPVLADGVACWNPAG